MRTRKSREIKVFGMAFLDILSNTVGGLAFILVIVFLLLGRRLIPDPVVILTESLPALIPSNDYAVWFSAQGGYGSYRWAVVDGQLPYDLKLEAETGMLSRAAKIDTNNTFTGPIKFRIRCDALGTNLEEIAKFSIHISTDWDNPAEPVEIATTSPLPVAFADQGYPLVLASRGGVSPYNWTLSGSLPGGLQLDKNGSFLGVPRDLGRYEFTIAVASHDGTKASRNIELEVLEKHPPPPVPPPLRILTDNLPDAVADRLYPLFPAADGGVPPYEWRLIADVDWLKPTQSKWHFQGKPGFDNIGTHRVVLELVDQKGMTQRGAPINIEVIPPGRVEPMPFELLTKQVPVATKGRDYHFVFSARGGYPPYQWTCTGLTELSGIFFDGEIGGVKGVPETVGEAMLTVRVVDTSGKLEILSAPLEVTVPEQSLHVVTHRAPLAIAHTPYELALSAVGGAAPYVWEIIDGKLPAGLALNPESGVISGIPSAPDVHSFIPVVGDPLGHTARPPEPVKIEVLSKQQAPKLIVKTDEIPLMVRDIPVRVALACEGGRPPYTWELTGDRVPGLKCLAGVLEGAPIDTGSYHITLTVHDVEGQDATANLPIKVRWMLPWWWLLISLVIMTILVLLLLIIKRRLMARPVPETLRIITETIPNGRASCDYSVQLAGQGGHPPYNWRVDRGELPPGMTLDPSGLLKGRPFEGVAVNDTKKVPFTIAVYDAKGTVDRCEL
jgi:large repetitive protein